MQNARIYKLWFRIFNTRSYNRGMHKLFLGKVEGNSNNSCFWRWNEQLPPDIWALRRNTQSLKMPDM